MGSMTGHGGYKLSTHRKFGKELFKKAGLAPTKEIAETFKDKLKSKSYKVRITKRTGIPYEYKYTVWAKKVIRNDKKKIL